MFSPIEKEAIYIILGMKGKQPKTLRQLVIQLFPDLADCSAPSLDIRVQRLKRILDQRGSRRRVGTSSLYYLFYRRQTLGANLDFTNYSAKDRVFLQEVHQRCPTWLQLQEAINNVLVGSTIERMAQGKKEVELLGVIPPSTQA